MMNVKLHKRIAVISVLAMIMCSLAALGLLFFKGEHSNYTRFDILMFWVLFIIFPFLSLVTSYFINHPEKTLIRRMARYTLYFSPLILILCFLTLYFAGGSTIISVLTGLLLTVYLILGVLQLFVFSDAGKLSGTIVLISLVIVGIVFKRLHLPLAGMILSISLSLLGSGFFLYGLRSLYLAEKNLFIKYVSFVACCIVTISLLGLLFKLQRWPLGSEFITIGRWGLVLGTITALLSLPSSGYFEWIELHKRILKRLIIPWGLLFLLFVIKFLLPEIDAVIWSKEDKRVYPGFEMFDYEIPSGKELETR